MKVYLTMVVVAVMFTAVGCKSKKAAVSYGIGPQTIVYKTKADYSGNVPVTLSEDKTKVIAYPAPQDIYYRGKLALPAALLNGYWLDNRGLSLNAAFLKLTYEEYATLKDVPDVNWLYNQLLDTDPFTEVYNLGERARFTNEVEEINAIIKKGGLKKFRKLK